MSKINAVRFINVSYNSGTFHISDECMTFRGKNTLISLANGGGKSVMIQMLMAPFLHKGKRDFPKRQFAEYFTTPHPSFILVEWVLDGGVGYVLTGLMVRQNQHRNENNDDELEIEALISEYEKPCDCDIRHLPVVYSEGGRKQLRSFRESCELFEHFKKTKGLRFFHYDMTSGSQYRSYFSRLEEFGIISGEWETITREINREEGGLAKFFSDCQDERRLIEKWFIPQIDAKINRERKILVEVQNDLESHILQYRVCENAFRQNEAIRHYQRDAQAIMAQAEKTALAEKEKLEATAQIAASLAAIDALIPRMDEALAGMAAVLQEHEAALAHLAHEQASFLYYAMKDEEDAWKERYDREAARLRDRLCELDACERTIQLDACWKARSRLDRARADCVTIREKLGRVQEDVANSMGEMARYGSRLRTFHTEELRRLREKEDAAARESRENEKALVDAEKRKAALDAALREAMERKGALESGLAAYEKDEDRYFSRYGVSFGSSLLYAKYAYPLDLFTRHAGALEDEKTELSEKMDNVKKRRAGIQAEIREQGHAVLALRRELSECEAALSSARRTREEQEKILKGRQGMAQRLGLADACTMDPESLLFSGEKLWARLAARIDELEGKCRLLSRERESLEKDRERLSRGFLEVTPAVRSFFEDLDVPVTFGLDWLRKNPMPLERKRALVGANPLLPYALLFDRESIARILGSEKNIETPSPLPLIPRDVLADEATDVPGCAADSGTGRLFFYAHVHEDALTPETTAKRLAEMNETIGRLLGEEESRRGEIDQYRRDCDEIRRAPLSWDDYSGTEACLRSAEGERKNREKAIRDIALREDALRGEEQSLYEEERRLSLRERELARQLEDCTHLIAQYRACLEKRKELSGLKSEIAGTESELADVCEKIGRYRENDRRLFDVKRQVARWIEEKEAVLGEYERYEMLETVGDDFCEADERGKYRALMEIYTSRKKVDYDELKKQGEAAEKLLAECEEEYRLHLAGGVDESDIPDTRYTDADVQAARCGKKRLTEETEKLRGQVDALNRKAIEAGVHADDAREKIRQLGHGEPLGREEIEEKDFDVAKARIEENRKADEKRSRELFEQRSELKRVRDDYAKEEAIPKDIGLPPCFAFESLDVDCVKRFVRKASEVRSEAGNTCVQLAKELEACIQSVHLKPIYADAGIPLPCLAVEEGGGCAVVRELGEKLGIMQKLLEKNEKDTESITEEQERLVAILLDYLEKMYEQMKRIDINSSIIIRGQSRKTLRIKIPSFEQNRSVYEQRIRDLIEEIRARCLDELRAGREIHNTVALSLAARTLFDKVTGIDSVSIELIKVQQQGEVSIPWRKVASNSGGEGALSFFFVLASLMSYMRHDERDAMATGRNEGKTLIMDNPFSQLNAPHLLKPLTEMAKLNNVQLLCFSGLVEESICDRFDNIYVLNLIESEQGEGYLKANQEKGKKTSVLSLSRLEVVDDESFLNLFANEECEVVSHEK